MLDWDAFMDPAGARRQGRLHRDGRDHDIAAGISDARQYRSLGLPVIDTTASRPAQVAADLAGFVRQNSPWDDPAPPG